MGRRADTYADNSVRVPSDQSLLVGGEVTAQHRGGVSESVHTLAGSHLPYLVRKWLINY